MQDQYCTGITCQSHPAQMDWFGFCPDAHGRQGEICLLHCFSGTTVSRVLSISKGKDRKMVSGFYIIQAFRDKLRRGRDTSNTTWYILEDVRDISSNYFLLPVNFI